MFEIGRVCIKIAGRDAGRPCIIIDVIDDRFVLIDGFTRRRKCNIKHLEPLNKVVEIKKQEEHEKVVDELIKLGFKPVKKGKPKESKERPKKRKKQKSKQKEEKEKKEKKSEKAKKTKDKKSSESKKEVSKKEVEESE